MKFTAAGDAIIQRRIQRDYIGYKELAPYINQGDAKFFNLETTLNCEGEVYGSQFSGGTYIRADPKVLYDLEKFGFNMTSFNNNHALDFSYGGLEDTLDALNKSNFIHAGVGRNLAMASAPRYLETESGRVALISVNTSFDPTLPAGPDNGRFQGRPGINGIRIREKLTVTDEELCFIERLAKGLKINMGKEIARNEGYLERLDGSYTELGDLRFYRGERVERRLEVNEIDMARVEKAIYEARFGADYIMISVHSHQIEGESKEDVPLFLSSLAHRCIDLGADAVVGHGPHLLRPIEVYKQKPIFYSLGDFILELYSVEIAPADFFEGQGIDRNDTVHALLKKRSRNFTVGLMEDKRMMESVIPFWETDGENRLISLKLMPIELNRSGNKSQMGLPRRAVDLAFIERLADMSRPHGVTMEIEQDGIVSCKW